jgi:peptidoglycan/LPS O-acetylase OafA/YrhL
VAKGHLLVLDGMRGTAAICVVVFHLSKPTFGNATPDVLWLRHAYLAVDFFFCLSGFVIGYAYDDRYGRMSVVAFIRARLVRLHPMVVAGLLLGLVSFCFDPFSGSDSAHPWMQPQVAPLWKVAANTVGGLIMVPTWPLPNRFGALFSLNSPAWSLMWEYFASVAFALLLWPMKRRGLSALVALAAAAIGVSAFHLNGLSAGFAWGEAKYGLIRVIFSFGMGLLIFRSGFVIPSRFGLGTVSLVMILLFFGPCSTQYVYNWAYDFALVTVALPLLVAIAAGANASGFAGRVCDLGGRVSYPLYMVHCAVVMVFLNYNWTHGITKEALPWVIAAITLGLVGFSYMALVFYDEPVRRWVGSRWVVRDQGNEMLGTSERPFDPGQALAANVGRPTCARAPR